MCIYGWDQNNWLIADSWPTASQKALISDRNDKFHQRILFCGVPAYKICRWKTCSIPANEGNRNTYAEYLGDNIGTATPLISSSTDTVYLINGPAVLGAGTGTYTIPGLQYLASKTVTWSYATTGTGTGSVILTPSVDGTTASMSFSGVSGNFSVSLSATITLPNGIVIKVSKPVSAISYSITKTNRCLATNKERSNTQLRRHRHQPCCLQVSYFRRPVPLSPHHR